MYRVKLTRRTRGMSLIEVLIALLVLSIGLAGMAALHLNSLTGVHSAHYRSLASTIALDFEERLWLAISDDSIVDVDAGFGSGCPNIDTVLTNLENDWNRAVVGENQMATLRLPGMAIEAETPIPGANSVQVPVVISWDESRIEDVTANRESLRFMARILCRNTT